MATALVTGGAGFLGSHLCEALLARGDRVICVDNLDTGSLVNVEHIHDGRFLFVSAMLDNRVYRVAPATGAIAGHFVAGVYPHDNKVSRDGRLLWLARWPSS